MGKQKSQSWKKTNLENKLGNDKVDATLRAQNTHAGPLFSKTYGASLKEMVKVTLFSENLTARCQKLSTTTFRETLYVPDKVNSSGKNVLCEKKLFRTCNRSMTRKNRTEDPTIFYL